VGERAKLKWYDDRVRVGQRLRAAREAAGLTQRDLATTDCTPAYISRIEKGERVPSLQLMREFAARLGVSDDYIAYGSGGRSRSGFTLAEARVALRLGELSEARRLADDALSAARSDSERALASAFLGEIALADGDYRTAVATIERARLLDRNIESREPNAADALGRAYARLAEHESALAVFGRARDGALERGDQIEAVRFGSLLAYAFMDTGDFRAAEQALVDVLRAVDGLDEPISRARALWAQSRFRALQNDTEAAALYAERALEILEVSDQDYYAALAHQLLAHIELDRGNGDRALELLASASPRIAASGRRFEQARFEIERARALLATGRREEAASVAMTAAAAIAGDLTVDAGRCYLLVADVFRELGEDTRARELYELAVQLLEASPTRYLVEAYSKLAQLLEDEGDEAGALAALKHAMGVQRRVERMLAPRRG
jgi:transcriptional regulator with XRE-family HTH domain